MTDNPWLSQPAATPYPTDRRGCDFNGTNEDPTVRVIAKALVAAYGEDAEKECPCEQDWEVARYLAPLLAEAERRGAERAWDGCVDHLRPLLGNQYEATRGANPYREPSSADLGAQEPVEVAGEGHDAQGGALGGCRCWECNPDQQGYRMFLCPFCGNKRCPRATDHRRQCTGSNDVNQTGSRYSTDWPEARLGEEPA